MTQQETYATQNTRPDVEPQFEQPLEEFLGTLMQEEPIGTCVTMVIPMQTAHPLSDQNHISLKTARQTLEERLATHGMSREAITDYLGRFDKLTADFDRKHQSESLALFIAERKQHIAHLPIQSQFYTNIADSFAIKHVMRAATRFPHTLVLNLNKSKVGVFEMSRETLRQIETEVFPTEYKAFIADFLSNTQLSKDRSEEKGERAWLDHIKEELIPITNQMQLPLIIAGTEKMVAGFQERWDRPGTPILGVVEGSYSPENMLQQLHENAIELYDAIVTTRQSEHAMAAREKAGERDTAETLRAIWPLAQRGQVKTLYVEQDFKQDAWVSPENNELHLEDTQLNAKDNYSYHDDAVESLIESVVNHGGEVRFLAQNALENKGHAVAHLRYA